METQINKGGWKWTILSILILAAFVVGLSLRLPWFFSLVLGVVFPFGMVFAVLEEWAPKNFVLTIMNEGTIKIITYGGEVVDILLRLQGHHLATDTDVKNELALRKWDIIEGDPSKNHRFGGYAFVGIPPFRKVWHYYFEWASFRAGKENEEAIRHHQKMLDYALAKWDTYVIDIPLETEDTDGSQKGIEDKNQIPLGVVGLFPMRIKNPYEAFFMVERWLPTVTGVLQPPLLRFIGRHGYRELISMKENGDQNGDDLWPRFWEEVHSSLKEKEEKTVDNLLTLFDISSARIRFYGIEIDMKRSGLIELDPANFYRQLSTLQYQAKQEGLAEVIRREAKGAGVSKELTSAIFGIAKQLAGLSDIEDGQLTADHQNQIQVFIPDAWHNYLAEQGIEAIKPTDKVIITGGGSQVGSDLAGLTVKEVIRQQIQPTSDKKKETKKEE